MYLWILASVLCFIFGYIKLYVPCLYWKKRNIKFIKPWPVVGIMLDTLLRRKTNAEAVQDFYNKHNSRYVGTFMFSKPTLLIRDIDLIKKMYIKDFDTFVERYVFIPIDAEPLFGRTLFLLQGDKWRDMRATLSPAFTGSKMRSMFTLIIQSAEETVKYFEKSAQGTQPITVEMKDVSTRYTNDVIASCAFGIKCDSFEDKTNEFYMMGKEITSFDGARVLKLIMFLFSPFLAKLLNLKLFTDKQNNFFRHLVKSAMQIREKEGIIRPDMIHLLMEAQKGRLKHEDSAANTDAGFATVEESEIGTNVRNKKHDWTSDDFTAQAIIFFVAGFDTSAQLISFMSHELAVNEDVQRKLQYEIDNKMKESNGKINYEILLKMKYLDMVVSETLRKWPAVAAVDRVCSKSYTIDPVEPDEAPLTLEKDMVVWVATYAMHRDPNYFPDPDKFNPERFSDENIHNITPLSFIPFGIGPRNCIGSRFALLEAKAFFVHLLAKFNLVVIKETQIPLRLSKASFNMTSEKGFWLGLQIRKEKCKTKIN